MLIEQLQAQSGLSRSKLLFLSTTASNRYKIYTIKKRNGGARTIAHPSRMLKAVQKWINKVLFRELPVHHCAMAYKKGANIRKNALMHVSTRFTLRMDFIDFFPSFSANGIHKFIDEQNNNLNWNLSEEDIEFVCSIVTRNGFLTIGAPSSPIITNAIMFEFDSSVFSLASGRELIYTRYADDLFISAYGPHELGGIGKEIEKISKDYTYARLNVNRGKTAYLSRRYRRSITGLVITPQGNVSIGRTRKREIRALVYRLIQGALPTEEIDRVRGLVSFSMDAEPLFFSSLCRKYGEKNIERIIGRNA